MSEFTKPTQELLDQIEPEAGQVNRPNKHRRRAEFWPDWDHISSPVASTPAVVAALSLSYTGVPERMWAPVIATHCPRTHQALTEHNLTMMSIVDGSAPAGSTELFARLVNTELGGYEVLHVPDVAAMTAEIIGELGVVPQFVDDTGDHAGDDHTGGASER